MDAALLELLTETVAVSARIGHEDSGEPIWGAPVQYRARVQWTNRLVRTTEGEVVASSTTTYLSGGAGLIHAGDRLTLASSEERLILSVGQSPDELGVSDAVLYA